MKLKLAKPEHEILYQDIADLLKKYADKLTDQEILAVAANMLGKMIALLDQRYITPQKAMEIVAINIEHGNKQVLENLDKVHGTKQ